MSSSKINESDLPLLASRAAIELENFRLGSPVSIDTAKELLEYLKNSLTKNYTPGSSDNFVDYGTAAVIGQALNLAHEKTIGDIVNEASKVFITLEKTTGETERNDKLISEMRDFFVAVSKSASFYKDSLSDKKYQTIPD